MRHAELVVAHETLGEQGLFFSGGGGLP